MCILPELQILRNLLKLKKKNQFLHHKSHISSVETATWLAVVLDSTDIDYFHKHSKFYNG